MKGISPLLASVMLIAFTLAVAAIVGSWMASMTKSSTNAVGNDLTKQVNCSKVTLDVIEVLCYNNTNLTIALQNMGSIPLTDPSFYIKTSDQTTCVNNQTDTISGGEISKYVINCADFGINKTLNFVRATALCEGSIAIYSEKTGLSDFCS